MESSQIQPPRLAYIYAMFRLVSKYCANLNINKMKTKTFYWLCYLVACNVVVFVMCGLPWHAVIALSHWYILLAMPLTCVACLVMGEFLILLDKEAEEVGDKRITWHDVVMFFLDV